MSVNNVRYADDTVIIAYLQGLVGKVTVASEKWELLLNTKKIKFVVMMQTTQNNGNFYMHNELLENVSKYNYLGTTIYQNNNSSIERRRIAKARITFMKT